MERSSDSLGQRANAMEPASCQTPTVFVVDDDPDVRDSLKMLITATGLAVRVFPSASRFLHHYQKDMPGCLLLDVRMPRQSGLDMYEQMLREGKRLPVIFITAHADVSTAVAALKTGAIEFLEKPFERVTLQSLIHDAMQLDAQWRERNAELNKVGGQIASLTQRERETLELIIAGEPNKVMAARLHITQRAVEMRRARIMQKLGVQNLAQLLDVAITHRVMTELRQYCRSGSWSAPAS